MARVNVDILGIRELKWTGMGKFNSDDLISTTVGKNPLEEFTCYLFYGYQENQCL